MATQSLMSEPEPEASQSPDQHSYVRENSQYSVESPFTSMGSASSFRPKAGGPHERFYKPLRARSQQASKFYEVKSQAVLHALASLQGKIRRLEEDRAQAEENLKALTSETSGYKNILQQKSQLSAEQHVEKMEDPRSPELEAQLEEAESRCKLLEKQLEYMRKLMQSQRVIQSSANFSAISPNHVGSTTYPTISFPAASVVSPAFMSQANPSIPAPLPTSRTSGEPSYERNGTSVAAQDQMLRQQPSGKNESSHNIAQSPAIEKLNELEREHVRLTVSQSLAETKIRELEEKIMEEKHYRKLMEDRAAKLEPSTHTAFASTDSARPQQRGRKKVKRKKQTSGTSAKPSISPSPATNSRMLSPSHYLADLSHLPFVVGQSTTKSHSLGANIQNVMSILKSHSNMCDSVAATDLVTPKHEKRRTTGIDSADSESALGDLLVTLQDEFAQLGFEHQDIAERIQKTRDERVRVDLERELKAVIAKLDTKGQQLQTVRKHMKKVSDKAAATRQPALARGVKTVTLDGAQEIEVVTSIRAKTPGQPSGKAGPHSNLEILRKVKKLQTTLRKDDLSWE